MVKLLVSNLVVDKFKNRISHLKWYHQAKAYFYLINICRENVFSVEYADSKKNSQNSSSCILRNVCPTSTIATVIALEAALQSTVFVNSRCSIILKWIRSHCQTARVKPGPRRT